MNNEHSASYGRAVSLSGNTALVGDFEHDLVYVFRDDGSGNWLEIAKLTDTLEDTQFFGISVALEGKTAVVGQLFGGRAHVFVEDNSGHWALEKILLPNESSLAAGFGRSVAISQNRALVGAQLDGGSGGPGSAYVFDGNNGWGQAARLTGDVIDEHARFGNSVSLDGNTAIIGAPFDGPALSGSAFVFREDENGNWSEVAKLRADSPTFTEERVGTSVAIHGDAAIVGAPFGAAAFIFEEDEKGDWLQTAALHDTSEFGRSVDIHGDLAAVGSQIVGNVHFYRRNGVGSWDSIGPLTTDRGFAFGFGMDLDEGRILVGESRGTFGEAKGMVLLFEAVPIPEPNAASTATFAIVACIAVQGRSRRRRRLLLSRGQT